MNKCMINIVIFFHVNLYVIEIVLTYNSCGGVLESNECSAIFDQSVTLMISSLERHLVFKKGE